MSKNQIVKINNKCKHPSHELMDYVGFTGAILSRCNLCGEYVSKPKKDKNAKAK